MGGVLPALIWLWFWLKEDRLAAEKLRRKLGPLKPKKCMRGSDIQHPVFEHDADSLYALIQEGGLDDDIVDPDEGTDD
jgi:hypothetical protein